MKNELEIAKQCFIDDQKRDIRKKLKNKNRRLISKAYGELLDYGFITRETQDKINKI